MRILAKGLDDSFIVEMSKGEIYRTMGYTGRFDEGAPREITIGMKIDIYELWSRLSYMRTNEGFLKAAAESLKHYAEMLWPIDEAIRKAITQPEDES